MAKEVLVWDGEWDEWPDLAGHFSLSLSLSLSADFMNYYDMCVALLPSIVRHRTSVVLSSDRFTDLEHTCDYILLHLILLSGLHWNKVMCQPCMQNSSIDVVDIVEVPDPVSAGKMLKNLSVKPT